MLNANGPGFRGLYAGDSIEFVAPVSNGNGIRRTIKARVLQLLVFSDHVQVDYGTCGYTVSADNFVRLVRRGKRHMAVDRQIAALERGKAKGQNIYD